MNIRASDASTMTPHCNRNSAESSDMKKTLNRRLFSAGALAAASLSATPYESAQAELATPTAKKILTISGKIRNFNYGQTAEFDRAMIEAMEQGSFRTKTPWYDGPVKFDGVLMTELMNRVGAFGDRVVAIALNDYTTEIPIADFARFGVLLAVKRDGNYMPVSDKGPLFIVYPYDSSTELSRPPYIGRSAWQVAQLIVK
jgi:hypothetical protein